MVTDIGVCIRQWDWSETSQTVSIFGRDIGIVRGLAKGAKRENARFSGGLEVMTRAEYIVSLKPTEGLMTLAAWDLQETFPAARASLSAFYSGMTMLDLVHHALREQDPHPELFDALLAGLRGLGTPAGDRVSLLRFLWAVLGETGHQPELVRDVDSGTELAPARSYAFNARLGGLTRDAGEGGTGVWRVRAETVELLRAVAFQQSLEAGDLAGVERATKLLALYFREVFACELPSIKVWLKD
ncbi:MAG TPA: DNA repair protein RecO [Phycisphaerales bacterium]|nr:DNA repair protein RecO [Phycisphaerales bacterium]